MGRQSGRGVRWDLVALAAAAWLAAVPARAQECVTCRSARCSQMAWIPACASKVDKPAPDKGSGPKGTPRPAAPRAEPPAPAQAPKAAAGGGLALDVDFPARVREHDLLGIRMRASREAWLIVLYVEENGPATVMWPSATEPAPRATPSHPASMPSSREVTREQIKIEAQLRTPGQPSRETFVVFALADRADFDRLKPAPGTTRPDGAAYVDELRRAIQAVRASARAEFTAQYVIEPAAR